MATYYVGIGGSDANNGTTWALRKLTLNAVEDLPVAAGDTVYVGPGTYRELLTVDVSGSVGSPITYIGDQTGANTDGVGGIVRITGSDDDQTATRANCITGTAKNYRTFKGFYFDTTTSINVSIATTSSNWIVEDCFFMSGNVANATGATIAGGTVNTIRRCVFFGPRGVPITFSNASTVDNTSHLVENCLFLGPGAAQCITNTRIGNITVKNCTFIGSNQAIRVLTAAAAGQTITVNNCLFSGNSQVFVGLTTADITEDYNNLWGNATDRTNTTAGANSTSYPHLFQPPMLLNNGRMEPWIPFSLMAGSQLRDKAGTGVASEDLWGIVKPQGLNSDWGAVEAQPLPTRNDNSGDNELKINGRGYFDFLIPVTDNTAITVAVKVRWDDNTNIGSKPQAKILADYGVSEQTVTATGTGGEETLTFSSITPQVPGDIGGVMILRLINRSTYTAAIAAYFDDITVT